MDGIDGYLDEYNKSNTVVFKILSKMAIALKDMDGRLNHMEGNYDQRFNRLGEMFENLVYNIQGDVKQVAASKRASSASRDVKNETDADASEVNAGQTSNRSEEIGGVAPLQKSELPDAQKDLQNAQDSTPETTEVQAKPEMSPEARALARKRWRFAISKIRLGVRTAMMSFVDFRAPANKTIGSRLDMVEMRLDALEEREEQEGPNLGDRISEIETMIEDGLIGKRASIHKRRSSMKLSNLMPDADFCESVVEMAHVSTRTRRVNEAMTALRSLNDDITTAYSEKKNEFKLSSLSEELRPLQDGISSIVRSGDTSAEYVRSALLKSLKLIHNTQAADAKLEGGCLVDVYVKDQQTALDARMAETKKILMDALEVFSNPAEMEVSIYNMEERTSDSSMLNRIDTRCSELIAEYYHSHQDDVVTKSEMNQLQNEFTGMGECVSELESLLKEQSTKVSESEEKTAVALQESMKEFFEALDGKANTEQMDDELVKVRDQMEHLQKMTYPKEVLERALANKIGKEDIQTLAKALKGAGGKNPSVDVGDPFFAVYKLNKPIKPQGMADIYAYPASYDHDVETGAREMEASTDISFPPIPGTPPSDQMGNLSDMKEYRQSEDESIEAGDVVVPVSKYSRMVPRPVKIRTTVGGGIPGNLPREALKKKNSNNKR